MMISSFLKIGLSVAVSLSSGIMEEREKSAG